MARRLPSAEINNLREAIEAQTAGLMQMLGTVAAQNAMLKEILAACTAEPENSPLADLLMQMNASLRRSERSRDDAPRSIGAALQDRHSRQCCWGVSGSTLLS